MFYLLNRRLFCSWDKTNFQIKKTNERRGLVIDDV